MAGKSKSVQKRDPIVDEYLEKGLNTTFAQYVDNAVWSAIREAVENKQSSALRKTIQEACEPKLVADAYAWKFKQQAKNNSSNESNYNLKK